jgi:hypothetical protein
VDTRKRAGDRRRWTGNSAVNFVLGVVAVALVVVIGSAWWASGGSCARDGFLACDTTARTVLAVGPAVVLGGGGITAFVMTCRVWRRRGEWRVWHGAGWALFVLMLLYAAVAASALIRGGA